MTTANSTSGIRFNHERLMTVSQVVVWSVLLSIPFDLPTWLLLCQAFALVAAIVFLAITWIKKALRNVRADR